ncbi:MAG: hypothetical protein ACOX60_04215 [Massiliimalia sp.]|jgi:hypothetical protein
MGGLKIVKRILFVLIILLVLWLAAITTDFFRMENGMEPLFCIRTGLHDDGKTGVYWGAGYKAYYFPGDGENTPLVSEIVPFWEAAD